MTETERYKTTGKLSTHPHILCVGCGAKVTAFGTNLNNKMIKAGGVEELISSFKCRSCSGVNVVKKPKAPKKTKKVKAAVEHYTPPAYNGYVKTVVNLNKERNSVTVTCWRPDLYLNAGRNCDDCTLFDICNCALKKLSKQKMSLITD
jgi:hypothetical protein